jgi:hypothetical protein
MRWTVTHALAFRSGRAQGAMCGKSGCTMTAVSSIYRCMLTGVAPLRFHGCGDFLHDYRILAGSLHKSG